MKKFLLALALMSRPGGWGFILLLSVPLALYGLTREGAFLTDLWRLIQPAMLLLIAALSALNLAIIPFRRKRRKAPPDAPRLTDAPRLKKLPRR